MRRLRLMGVFLVIIGVAILIGVAIISYVFFTSNPFRTPLLFILFVLALALVVLGSILSNAPEEEPKMKQNPSQNVPAP